MAPNPGLTLFVLLFFPSFSTSLRSSGSDQAIYSSTCLPTISANFASSDRADSPCFVSSRLIDLYICLLTLGQMTGCSPIDTDSLHSSPSPSSPPRPSAVPPSAPLSIF
ncbi:hypothetical protein LY76DRAFT_586475 [Colletotrichum caudatum]|nr:hypothetical protein LY76DRAFT_586475 [Colletotrichum caudatum]